MQSVLFLFPETIQIYHVVSDCGLIYLLAGCKMMPLCTEDVYTAHCIPSTRHITCEQYIQPLFKSYLCKEEKNEREREHEGGTCARARKGARQRERARAVLHVPPPCAQFPPGNHHDRPRSVPGAREGPDPSLWPLRPPYTQCRPDTFALGGFSCFCCSFGAPFLFCVYCVYYVYL
jgi:hypothetical protein